MSGENALNLGAFDKAPESCASNFVGVGGLLRSSIANDQVRVTVVAPIKKQRYGRISTFRIYKGQVYKMQL